MNEKIIGTTGKLVDLFKENLTQEEWNALCIVHRLGKRLNIGIRFDYEKSIDVHSSEDSQIIDESVFLKRGRGLDLENLSKMIDKELAKENLTK